MNVDQRKHCISRLQLKRASTQHNQVHSTGSTNRHTYPPPPPPDTVWLIWFPVERSCDPVTNVAGTRVPLVRPPAGVVLPCAPPLLLAHLLSVLFA